MGNAIVVLETVKRELSYDHASLLFIYIDVIIYFQLCSFVITLTKAMTKATYKIKHLGPF